MSRCSNCGSPILNPAAPCEGCRPRPIIKSRPFSNLLNRKRELPEPAAKAPERYEPLKDPKAYVAKVAWSGKHTPEIEITKDHQAAAEFNAAQKRRGPTASLPFDFREERSSDE